MADEQFSNNARTTLANAIDNTVTSLTVASAAGFPGSAQYRVRIGGEILLVTGGAGTTTWTVTRGVEGTTAAAHPAGSVVTHILTAAALRNVPDYARRDLLTSKGDLYVATGAGEVTRLPVGSNGLVLQADSGEATGLKWAAGGGAGGGVTVLDRDVTEVEVVNTTTETTVYSSTVPGGTLGTDGMLEMVLIGRYFNNSGSNRTFTVIMKYGGTAIYRGLSGSIGSGSDPRSFLFHGFLGAAGATNAQRCNARQAVGRLNAEPPTGTGTTSVSADQQGNTSVAVDSTADQTLEIAVMHNAANANLSFKAMVAILTKR